MRRGGSPFRRSPLDRADHTSWHDAGHFGKAWHDRCLGATARRATRAVRIAEGWVTLGSLPAANYRRGSPP